MKTVILGAVSLLTCSAAMAQFPLQGFLHGQDRTGIGNAISFSARFGLAAEEHLTRVDSDDYKDWGLNAQGLVQVQGFLLYVLDTNDGTAEQFSVIGYEENSAQLNFPDVANRRLNAGPYAFPPTPTGQAPGARAYRLWQTLTQPVTMQNGVDLFFGTAMPATVTTTAPIDGLWTGIISADPLGPGTPPVFDTPGPAGAPASRIANDTYACYVVNNVPTYIAPTATAPIVLEQFAVDVFISGGAAGGVAIAQTNQPNYASSNAPNYTSNFLSGLHPDVAGASAGRADNIGFALTSHTAQVTSGVGLVLLAFGPSPVGTQPVAQLFPFANAPGTTGNVCIDFTVAANFFVFLTTGQQNSLQNMLEGQVIVPFSPSARTLIGGLASPVDIWWQGFVLDSGPGPLEVRATGCAIQKLK